MRNACLAATITLFLSGSILCSSDNLLGKLMYKVLTVEERMDNLETQFQSALNEMNEKLDTITKLLSTKTPSIDNTVGDMKETIASTVAEIVKSQYTVLGTFVKKEKTVLSETKRELEAQGYKHKVDIEQALQHNEEKIEKHAQLLTSKYIEMSSGFDGSFNNLTFQTKTELDKQDRTFVSFSTRLTTKLPNTAAGTIIKFDQIINNYGSHYNSNTGKFTVPVSGMYLFIFYIASHSEGTTNQAHVGLYVDKTLKTAAISDSTNGDNNDNGGNSVIVQLDREQEVYIKTYTWPDKHDIWAWKTTFSGALLHSV
ncbi:C1QL2-like protein [Mya arenaria]|uniref:C1QL2-like protein n=1 Tax=Mya arenaria TaxID=6604 RepID=A0ABY7EYA4_MYAAR|nr:C1QL2-like protein [Mya arenaria]WAR14392.1 C1QL2-like protein [Mya arenaria]